MTAVTFVFLRVNINNVSNGDRREDDAADDDD